MRITENQLRQIVRKELLLNESVTLTIAGFIGFFAVLQIIKTFLTQWLQGGLKNIEAIYTLKTKIMNDTDKDNDYIEIIEHKIKQCRKTSPENIENLKTFLSEVERNSDILESVMTNFSSQIASETAQDAVIDATVFAPTLWGASFDIAGKHGTRSISRQIVQFFVNIADDSLSVAGIAKYIPYIQIVIDATMIASNHSKLKGLASELDVVESYMTKFRNVGAEALRSPTMDCNTFIEILVSEEVPGITQNKVVKKEKT